MRPYLLKFIFLFCFVSTGAFAASTEQLLETIKFNKYIKSIKAVKTYKSLDEIPPKDYELRYYFNSLKLWYYFDEDVFKKTLTSKMEKNFNQTEINHLYEIFSKPFMNKMLGAMTINRNVFDFNENLVNEDFFLEDAKESRINILKNFYNLFALEIQKEFVENKLRSIIGSGKTKIKVLNKKNKNVAFIDPKELRKRLKAPKLFLLNYLAMELKKFNDFEFREFIRLSKDDQILKKFLPFYANFHFLYLTKYISKVELDKLNQLKIIDSKDPKVDKYILK